jgi:hypothetical protein
VLLVSTCKENEMKYLLQKYDGDRYDVINDDADSLVASARPAKGGPGYRVHMALPNTDDDEYREVVIKSIDEAIPTVAAHYEANPPRWEPESDLTPRCAAMEPCRARYFKETQFGYLWVGQVKSGKWAAYRDGHGLSVAGGKIAKFATREEAQCAADAHFRDGYPNSEMINDGLSWPVEYEWWLDPYRPAIRARLAPVAAQPAAPPGTVRS